jgi:uncharacterized protein with FMN-binding domain
MCHQKLLIQFVRRENLYKYFPINNMEPVSSINRTVGIVLAALTIVGVGGITFVSERSAPSAASLTQNNSSPLPAASTPFAPVTTTKVPTSSPTVTTKTTYVLKCSGDEDNQKCVNVPVTTTVSTAPKSTTPTTPTVPTPPPAIVPKQTASVYKNGTYTATGSYGSPSGEEQIAVTVTIANDVITNSSVTPMAYGGTSLRYQNAFISGYKQYVIGQNIAGINLTYVSGASLTPAGFNDALTQIKVQAKA